MDLRLRGLADVDPRQVPLPAGTEVVARVDRTAESGRLVPQGAVGRVARVDGDAVEVMVVGVGLVKYARGELVPRKQGQWRFARRREAAWAALTPCVVLEAVVGSRAWGLDDAASDVDRRGVFVLPMPWTAGLAPAPGDLVSADGSATYWEIDKAARQALRGDPNTLETLFVDGVEAKDEMGAWLLAARDAFVSVEIHGTFGRYAVAQLARLAQAARLARHRADVLTWLRAEPGLALDDVAARLAAADGSEVARAKEHVKQLYRSLHDQGLTAANDFAALVAFASAGGAPPELPRELRPKNAYNLLRLIATATEWLKTGRPTLRVAEPLRGELLAIKRGEVPLDQVLRRAEALTPALEQARHGSPLPKRPDVAAIDALLKRVREEAARRWVVKAPGPWGHDAPPAPVAAWEDERDEGDAET